MSDDVAVVNPFATRTAVDNLGEGRRGPHPAGMCLHCDPPPDHFDAIEPLDSDDPDDLDDWGWEDWDTDNWDTESWDSGDDLNDWSGSGAWPEPFRDQLDDPPAEPPIHLGFEHGIRRAIDIGVPDCCRRQSGVSLFICDERDLLAVQVLVEDAPPSPSTAECDHLVSTMARAACIPRPGMLLVVHRPAPLYVTESDQRWRRALYGICPMFQTRPLGVWLATPGVAREIALDDAG